VRTLADYLEGRPAATAEMFARILGAARGCGPVELEALDKQVVLHGSRRIVAILRASGAGFAAT
jgi:hypothetical protein